MRDAVKRGPEEPSTGVPILLCIGENDQAVTPQLAPAAPRRRHLHFEVIPRAGHFVCDTHANVVADRIRSFL